MLKNRKYKLVIVLILFVFGIPSLTYTNTGALSYTKSDRKKIAKQCSNKLDIPLNTKKNGQKFVLGACQEGYIVGLEHPRDSSACISAYKGHSKALHACRVDGFRLGKSNPDKIKGKDTSKGGKGEDCKGSECSPTPTGSGSNCDSEHCDLVSLYINPAVRLLSLLVGLVVAGSLVMGGVQYAAAGSDPQKVSAAKSRISNTLMAFFAFAFLYAFLNFLIPGGIF